MGIDLSVIWFVIIVFATLMYIVMDGFDLGIGILFTTTRDTADRDVMVNSVAPVWDGNETWLVLGGAGLFGAFPLAYRGHYRCAGDPAHPDVDRSYFSRRCL
ncbi:Cytochrome bd2 [Klebsiella oxytoca]|nr:Cytochrome bd2 [Klebsiella oxytoca]